MSFFHNLFSSPEQDPSDKWGILDRAEQIDQLIERSHEVPVAIFKHSVRCGISAMAKAQLEAEWDLQPEQVELYHLDLIRHRDVSNLIAEKLGVWHQSPQIILLQDGQATYHASHQAIRVAKVKAALAA